MGGCGAINVLLVDLNPGLCEQWQTAFADAEDVHVHNGPFESLLGRFDCLVSPANSFGLMDGGIDAAIIRHFAPALQDSVQREIWRCYRGELPVGTCLMVPTGNAQCPWLAHCHSMRVPMDVSWTNHAYAAFLAALIAAEAARVTTLACHGLGTLTGKSLRMSPPGRCASPSTSGAHPSHRPTGKHHRTSSGAPTAGRGASF